MPDASPSTLRMAPDLHESQVTPEHLYLNRRNFIRAGVAAGSVLATGLLYRYLNPPPPEETAVAEVETPVKRSEFSTEESSNSYKEITNYNNFYEFSTSKGAVAREAATFITDPWSIDVGGLVGKPRVFGLEELLKFEQEERIYRFRCVEGWSMVIPWIGFPVKKLLDAVEPASNAKYVSFQTFFPGENPTTEGMNLPPGDAGMPNNFFAGIEFPYVEGLRLDEAMHPLTILATGLYGRQMPSQNGAPVRLVVPWKYGFKSIKSIVRITLTEDQPPTTWNIAAPREYGFYSNVNPEVDHPRWSQATERRIGEFTPRKTLMFNGYEEEVADLYKGMDLRKFY